MKIRKPQILKIALKKSFPHNIKTIACALQLEI